MISQRGHPESQRLILRDLESGDIENLLSIVSDPVAMKYYPTTLGRDDAQAWIDRHRAFYESHGHGLWAAILRETDQFVGQVGLIPQEVEGQEETEIGYLFVRQFWGQGLATEGAMACRDYAFEELGRKRLVSLIDPRNQPSRRVAERVGMQLERRVEKWNKPICVYAMEREGGAT